MNIRIIGAILVFCGCGAFGMQLVCQQVREEKGLQALLRLLEFMENELTYRLTPLPLLCRQAAQMGNTAVHKAFEELYFELDAQVCPDVNLCMSAALKKVDKVPDFARKGLLLLGSSLGRYDLEGQIKGIGAVKVECKNKLEQLAQNKDIRLRSYQTLSLCAGAALAILLI